MNGSESPPSPQIRNASAHHNLYSLNFMPCSVVSVEIGCKSVRPAPDGIAVYDRPPDERPKIFVPISNRSAWLRVDPLAQVL
jgi:hypothetical protein